MSSLPESQNTKTFSRCRVGGWIVAWPFPLAVLLLWYLAALHEWVPPQILPSPQAVGLTLWELMKTGELVTNLFISMIRVFSGFAIGMTIGLALGTSMGLSPRFKDYVFPLFKAVSYVPVIAWIPLLMLLVGIDETLKFVVIAKATLVPITLNTYQGIKGVPNIYIEVARVHGLSRTQMLTKVVFPAAIAPIWNGMRYGFTNAWLALIVVELLASSEGVGFMIVYGRQLFQLDVVLAVIAVMGILGFVLDKLLALIETRLLHWRQPGI